LINISLSYAFILFSVVICPLSVTEGWALEIVKFTPKLEVFKYVGDKENRCNLRMKIREHVTRQSSTMSVSTLYFLYAL